MDVAGRQRERDDLAFMIEHQMQLEAEEPASAGLAAPGQAGKHLVAVDPTRVTHRQGGAVEIVEAALSSHRREQKDRQGHPHMVGQSDEAGIVRWPGKSERAVKWNSA